jgi:uncharacterized protein (TIGR03083 family)
VNVDGYVTQLDGDGKALAAAVERVGLDAVVPTCPDWRVRDLVAHVGRTHRWAESFVANARTDPPQGDGELADPPAHDAELLPWFTDGHAALVRALRKASPVMECWTFLPAPSPLTFWARRQAHETAIHRVDVESTDGRTCTFGSRFAVDGIDELMLGFFARSRSRLISDPPKVLGVRAEDGEVGDAWTMSIGPTACEVTRGKAHGDCIVSGPASDLYQFLWNRRDADGLDVSGDPKVLDLWRAKATVTWT